MLRQIRKSNMRAICLPTGQQLFVRPNYDLAADLLGAEYADYGFSFDKWISKLEEKNHRRP